MRSAVTVTRDELQNYQIAGRAMSTGDGDVRLLEIATEKYASLEHFNEKEMGLGYLRRTPWWETNGKAKRFIENRLITDSSISAMFSQLPCFGV